MPPVSALLPRPAWSHLQPFHVSTISFSPLSEVGLVSWTRGFVGDMAGSLCLVELWGKQQLGSL